MYNGWTSRTAEYCLGLTAHFVNDDFKMESVTIGIVKLVHQDKNDHASAIKQFFSEYDGLNQRVRLLVTGGSSVMKSTAAALGLIGLIVFHID